MTALDMGGTADLFVSIVLNGTVAGNGNLVDEGTVLRINLAFASASMPTVESMTTIGSGFPERTDPVVRSERPAGSHGGSVNGDIFSVNGNNGLLVVSTPSTGQIGHRLLDISGTPPGNGALFGLATAPEGLYFVDDDTNTLNLLKK
jgi:hypothetical protein